MRLYGISFVIFLFVSFSLFYHSKLRRGLKIIGTLIIFAISMKYVIYQVVGGAFFAPALPSYIIIIMESLYASLILLFFLLLLWDFYQFINWLLSKMGMPIPRNIPREKIVCVLIIGSLLLGAWGTWETIRVPDVNNLKLTLKDYPCSLNGLKIVQLTDLHIGPILKKDWLEKVVAKVNSLNPDFIALTGDYIDDYVANIGQELAPLANLKSTFGIFAVTGNHEYYWNVTEWEDEIKKLGVTWLNNEHHAVEIAGENVIISGIPDSNAKRFGFSSPNLKQALKDAPEGIKILLSHQPRHAEKYLKEVDLQLSGHTHGGIMFFLGPIIAHYNKGFLRGVYEIGNKKLYVSPGTGLWNGFSSRIGVPAEITLITLQCSELDEEKNREN